MRITIFRRHHLKASDDPLCSVEPQDEEVFQAQATMKKIARQATPSIQSLGRGLSILRRSQTPKRRSRSSISRLARHRSQQRLPSRYDTQASPLPRGRARGTDYILGPSIWRGSRKNGQNLLTSLCRDHLRALSVTTGETAHLAVRDGTYALFIDHCTPPQRVLSGARPDR